MNEHLYFEIDKCLDVPLLMGNAISNPYPLNCVHQLKLKGRTMCIYHITFCTYMPNMQIY